MLNDSLELHESFHINVLSAGDIWIALEHEFKVSVLLVAAQLHLGSKMKQNRTSYKMLQKSRKKKKNKSSVCVLTAFLVIYTEGKNCVDFMSLLGENY